MKKIIMAILLGVALQGAVPVHAISMPSFRMPYEAAKQRVQATKDRVFKAMKTNKKAVIAAAVTALFIALGALAMANRRGQQAQSVYPPLVPVQEQEVVPSESEEVVPSESEEDVSSESEEDVSSGSEEEFFSAESGGEEQDPPLLPVSQEDIMRARSGYISSDSSSPPTSPRTSPRPKSPTDAPLRYGIYSSK